MDGGQGGGVSLQVQQSYQDITLTTKDFFAIMCSPKMCFFVLFIFPHGANHRHIQNPIHNWDTWLGPQHDSILHLWSGTNHFMSLLISNPLPTSSEIAILLRQCDEWSKGRQFCCWQSTVLQCISADCFLFVCFLLLFVLVFLFVCFRVHWDKFPQNICVHPFHCSEDSFG